MHFPPLGLDIGSGEDVSGSLEYPQNRPDCGPVLMPCAYGDVRSPTEKSQLRLLIISLNSQ